QRQHEEDADTGVVLGLAGGAGALEGALQAPEPPGQPPPPQRGLVAGMSEGHWPASTSGAAGAAAGAGFDLAAALAAFWAIASSSSAEASFFAPTGAIPR